MLHTTDTDRRPLRQLRISVTDRCNLRCAYCMPAPRYHWLPRAALLDFHEIRRLAALFVRLGVRKLRLTGGEPLLRRDLPALVRTLAELPLDDLALTTNGVRLAELAQDLADAGLRRVTVSLDTLRPLRFRAHTRRDALPAVLAGIAAARAARLPLKLNAVVIRGFNEDELAHLLAFARTLPAELRFIEYMHVRGDDGDAPRDGRREARLVAGQEILARVATACGRPRPVDDAGTAPARRYALPDGTTFGVIAAATTPFCDTCDRARLTADGQWHTCLFGAAALDLRGMLRGGAPDAEIAARIQESWRRRADRGAEQFLTAESHAATLPGGPRRTAVQMHVRGG